MSSKAQKKRSNSETLEPKTEGQSPLKKHRKHVLKKVENLVAVNGDAPKPVVQGETLTAKQRKRQASKNRKLAAIARVKEEGGVPKPLWPKKDKKSTAVAAEPKDVEAKLKAKQEKRAEAKQLRQEKRQQEGQYKVDQVKLSVDEIRLRISEIKGRETISKTAKRKLAILLKKLATEEGTAVVGKNEKDVKNGNQGLTESEKRRIRREKKEPGKRAGEEEEEEEDPSVEKPVDIQSFEIRKKKNKKNASAQVQKPKIQAVTKPVEKKNDKDGKGKKVAQIVAEEEDEEEEEDDESDDADEAEAEAEAEAESEGSDEEEEEEEEDEEDEEEEEEEEEVPKPAVKKSKKEQNQGVKKERNQGPKQEVNQEQNSDKKKRYILFVGNIPFDAKPDEIKSHFLGKVGEVSSVRIPTNPGTQVSRGFCYVEVTNDVDYEKGLSLHHSFLSGRRINVEYTLAGSKQVSKRKELVSKNQKLHAMRKAGQLAGSQKHDQKRSVRRFKKREQDRTPN